MVDFEVGSVVTRPRTKRAVTGESRVGRLAAAREWSVGAWLGNRLPPARVYLLIFEFFLNRYWN